MGKKLSKKTIIFFSIGLLLLLPGIAGLGWKILKQPLVPKNISNQISFTILVPKASDYKLIPASIRYDASAKVLTYNIHHQQSTITLTEQATPDIIASYPEMLSKQFDMMKNKKAISTPTGTAYVATNQELNQKQVAAINAKGTLLFAQPTQALDEDTWRQLFHDFQEIK
jgi:hypothetical protein